MDELLKNLEAQIKTLIDQHQETKTFNQQLHHVKFQLSREKERLLAKQEKAASQIEALVSKLKVIEK